MDVLKELLKYSLRIVLIVFALYTGVWAQQPYQLNLEEVSLKTALEELGRQANRDLIFSSSKVDLTDKVSVLARIDRSKADILSARLHAYLPHL